MMIRKRIAIIAFFLILTSGVNSYAQNAKETAQNWDEMMHYTLIGQWDLAQTYGQALLESDPDPVQLLDLAQAERYADSYRNLALLKADSPIKEIASKILKLIEEGRFLQRTDTQRIDDEVRRLSSTTRGRMLAVKRLKDSGEWAVPIMIQALRDTSRQDEFSNIRWALPQLGKPAVNPLVVALQQNDALNIRLIILEALEKISYHSAAPYIEQVLETAESNPELKAAARKALRQIYRRQINHTGGSASELFEKLAEDYYRHLPSLQIPANEELGTIWFWDEKKGLVYERVPREGFDELMTLRCCEYAVQLDPHRGTAISLWLSAFFRLEAEGQNQPGYFAEGHADASTYALTAGPEYLHRVLTRALKNRNRAVALSSIQVLQRNSGQKSLLYELDTKQPIIAALQYADREIRYNAAITLGQALPLQNFQHSELVMPILAEAIVQKGEYYAIVVDTNQQRRNDLVAKLRDSGYADVVAEDYFSVAIEQSKRLPSIDMIILSGNSRIEVQNSLETAQDHFRLAFSPTLIISQAGTLSEMRKLKDRFSFIDVVLEKISGQQVQELGLAILERNQAIPFDKSKADQYAVVAANVVRQLAVTGNQVLLASAVESTMHEAVREPRHEIQVDAIWTLAQINSLDAQRTLATLALDINLDSETRLLALRQLSTSAKAFGNMLLAEHISGLLKIIRTADASYDFRNLSAQAYGALNLPSLEISELITEQIIERI